MHRGDAVQVGLERLRQLARRLDVLPTFIPEAGDVPDRN